MPYCLKCAALPCGESTGLISMNFSMNSSIRAADDCFNTGLPTDMPYIPGPATGSFTSTYYAFEQGQDKWLGSRCKGQAQASQTNVLRYDYCTDKYWLIPTKVHKAQIAGDLGDKVSLKKVFFKGSNIESQATQGMSIATEMETWLGAELAFTGNPLPLTIPTLNPYQIYTGNIAYASSINISVDYPNNPGVVSYTFDFMLDKS